MDPIYYALGVIVFLLLAVGMLVAKGTGKSKVSIVDGEALRFAAVAPIITPTARSTALPFTANSLNSFQIFLIQRC